MELNLNINLIFYICSTCTLYVIIIKFRKYFLGWILFCKQELFKLNHLKSNPFTLPSTLCAFTHNFKSF